MPRYQGARLANDVDTVLWASNHTEDSGAFNAAQRKVLVDLADANLEHLGLAHVDSIAITTRSSWPGPSLLRSRSPPHLLYKGLGAHMKAPPHNL